MKKKKDRAVYGKGLGGWDRSSRFFRFDAVAQRVDARSFDVAF